jgi:hypothetical protein
MCEGEGSSEQFKEPASGSPELSEEWQTLPLDVSCWSNLA